MKKSLLDQIRSQINKAQVVSFDIFDTLLVRPYVTPTDLFVHMEKAYARPGFASERRDAERRTRIRHKELEDITFDMIYEEIDPEFRDLKQKELDWEAMVLRPNPELKQVYDYALAQGKRIIIASDMYLPTEFIASVLRKNGFDRWEKLYVSGDVGAKKGTGTLYKHMIHHMGVLPSLILHIGDHEHSDYRAATGCSIEAVLIRKIVDSYVSENKKAFAFLEQNRNAFAASLLIGIFAYRWQKRRCDMHPQTDYWNELGFQYTGPLAYGFGKFVEDQALKDKIEHLLFISRSGYILKKVFDTFDSTLRTSYVYSSRLIKYICDLNFGDVIPESEKIANYFCSKSPVLAEKYDKLANKNKNAAKRFINNNMSIINEIAQKNRSLYNHYLSTVISGGKNNAVVDDTARFFSAQLNIEVFLKEKLKGFYINVVDSPHANNFLYSAFHETIGIKAVSDQDAENRSWCWTFIEFLIGAPESPISDVSEEGVVLSQDIDNNEKQRIKKADIVCNGALSFAKEIKELFHGHNAFIDYQTIIRWINSFLLHPDKVDYQAFFKLKFPVRAFGTDSHPLLVRRSFLDTLFKRHKPVGKGTGFYWDINKGLIFDYDKRDNYKEMRLFGLPLYKMERSPILTKTKILFGLIKKVRKYNEKRKYILGICISKKINKENTAPPSSPRIQNRDMSRCLAVYHLHSATFGQFKNIHKNDQLVIVGTAPSLQHYQFNPEYKHIGLNRAFLYPKLKLDYLFMQDYEGMKDYIRECASVDCIKFWGIFLHTQYSTYRRKRIPESIINDIGGYRFYNGTPQTGFEYDLCAFPLHDEGTVAHPALQFALWSGAKKIYLVGCDTALTGYYDSSIKQGQFNTQILINGYSKLKSFAELFYPDTEIISINPVGLRGIFKDVYTRSFLSKHPEIDLNGIEILEEDSQ